MPPMKLAKVESAARDTPAVMIAITASRMLGLMPANSATQYMPPSRTAAWTVPARKRWPFLMNLFSKAFATLPVTKDSVMINARRTTEIAVVDPSHSAPVYETKNSKILSIVMRVVSYVSMLRDYVLQVDSASKVLRRGDRCFRWGRSVTMQ